MPSTLSPICAHGLPRPHPRSQPPSSLLQSPLWLLPPNINRHKRLLPLSSPAHHVPPGQPTPPKGPWPQELLGRRSRPPTQQWAAWAGPSTHGHGAGLVGGNGTSLMRTSYRSLSPYGAQGITGNNSRFFFFVKMYLIAKNITDFLHFPPVPPIHPLLPHPRPSPPCGPSPWVTHKRI